MALSRVISDALLVRGYVVTGADIAGIDQNTFVSINGDTGGSWSPADDLEIGGAGMIAGGPWLMSGSHVQTAGPIEFGGLDANDFWHLDSGHPAESASLATPFAEVFAEHLHDDAYVLSTSLVRVYSAFTKASAADTIVRFAVPLNVYNGASLDDVVFEFDVNGAHVNVPQYLPQFRVIAVDADGNVESLRAADAYTDTDGFLTFHPTPASGAAWNGNDQQFTYTCNQNNIVDVSKYSYMVQVIDEHGTDATGNNIFKGVETTFSGITVLDGRE